jgi:hypothetical protein
VNAMQVIGRVAVCCTAIGCMLAGLACAESPGSSAHEASCAVEARNMARIKPETSRLSCAAAKPIIELMNGTVGMHTVIVGPRASDGAVFRWHCRLYPLSSYPVEVKCALSKRRFFEVIATAKR